MYVQHGHQPQLRIAYPPPSPQQPKGAFQWCDDLWNSKRHVPIIICAALWFVCPLDLDFVPILGWIDDGFAIALGTKHFFDLFKSDALVAPPPPPVQHSHYPVQRPPVLSAQVVEPWGDVIDAEFTVEPPAPPPPPPWARG
jgi:hypothetical protein